MKYFLSTLRTGLAVAALALLPITEAAAQIYTPTSTPRVCDIAAGQGNVVRITAGPFGEFPKKAVCGSDACLQWDYRWQFIGINPSLSLVSVGSNVTVHAPSGSFILPVDGTTRPTSFDSSINFGNVGGEVGIKYSANSDTYEASFFTDTAAIAGTVTAGFKSGNRNGFCAIAGATNPRPGNSDLSTPKEMVTTSLGCTVKWTQSADGCVTGAAITGQTTVQGKICSVTPRADQSNKQSLLNLHAASNSASCGTEINAPGSTNICRYNSFLRTYTCVTVEP